jgi:TonB family protein
MLTAEAVHRHDDERRSCRRATLQWVVLVYFGQDQWGKLIDLSERGMCFQFEHPPALRQSINFTFEAMGCMAIPTEAHEGNVFGDSIQATGRVKWTREFERIAGVEFLELSSRSRDQIRYWISTGASPEAASPSQEFHHEWKKKGSKRTERKAAPLPSKALASAPHAAPELAPFSAKASFEPREEVFESDLKNSPSNIEVVWEPEPSPPPPTLDEPATPRKKLPREPKREAAFTPIGPDAPAISRRKGPAEAEPENSFMPRTLDEPVANSRKWPVEPQREAAFAEPALDEPPGSHRKWSREPEPESAFAAPALDEPPAPHRKWSREPEPESAFAAPALDEPPASDGNWPPEPEPEPSYLPPTFDEAAAVELREKLDALSHRKRAVEFEPQDAATAPTLDEPVARPRKWFEPTPEPESRPEELGPVPSERQGFWGSKAALDSQGVDPLGLEVPDMLHHDERHRRGQTLELRQRRGHIGFIAVLGFLATAGALTGIIRFTSKFNERAEATEVSRPSENKAASSRGEAGTPEATSPFLVEVLDAGNRRSVLVFSGEAHPSKSGRGAQASSLPETSVMAVQEPREETKKPAIKGEASRDFTLIAPHAATSVTANSALEAPALPTSAPASVDAPLANLPSPTMPGAVDRTPPIGGEVQPARLVHAVLPSYPQIARSNRVAGDVTLDALVDETGNVKDVKVLSGPLLLREAAQDAVRQWKYQAARLDGHATAMHLTVTVKFQNNQDNR